MGCPDGYKPRTTPRPETDCRPAQVIRHKPDADSYLTGLVSVYLEVVEPRSVASIGFLLSTFGGSLIAAITGVIKAADLWAFIRSKSIFLRLLENFTA